MVFCNPAHVYQRCVRPDSSVPSTASACASAPSHEEPPVYYPIAPHQDSGHVHPMVTRRVAGVLRSVDCLVLSTTSSLALSPEPPLSVVRSSTPTGCALWRSTTVRGLTGESHLGITPRTWCHAPLAPMWSPGNGSSSTS
jgi:hypothetical protein